jgi:putative ABC transport system substrate-binding protein
MADELVRRQVSVIATASQPASLAAKQATATIPIVFSLGVDPIALGLTTSFDRPNGNATGILQLSTGLEAKRLISPSLNQTF